MKLLFAAVAVVMADHNPSFSDDGDFCMFGNCLSECCAQNLKLDPPNGLPPIYPTDEVRDL